MTTAEIGINITENGIEYFGLEELNELIKQGQRVTSIAPGEVMVAEIEDDEAEEEEAESPQFSLAGFTMQVELAEK